jgi:hypothetical protein
MENKIKKIAVCGCSFSSPVGGEYTGLHWAEQIAQELNAELLMFARQGISNNAIRLQINEAIKHQPDFVFINATTPDRIEFPVMHDPLEKKSYYVGFNGAYQVENVLKNFNYPGHDNTMISETIFSIIDWPHHPYRDKPIDSDTKFATKLYAALLYDPRWKSQCDSWALNSGLWKLHNNNINFLYNPWILEESVLDLPTWFHNRYCVDKSLNLNNLMHKYQPVDDPGFHTTAEGQEFIKTEYLKFVTKNS